MCILLVEDELLIRLTLTEELAKAGFAVCQAPDGERAAALIEDPPTPLLLLVTDIHMPGRLNGLDVARRMRQRNPAVPIIYMTGRPDSLPKAGALGEKEACLVKPFRSSKLLALARQLLA